MTTTPRTVTYSKLRYPVLSAPCRLVNSWWLTVVLFVGYRDVTRFFALAHEITHNLVESHNSEYELYFSAIREAHILALPRLIGVVEV